MKKLFFILLLSSSFFASSQDLKDQEPVSKQEPFVAVEQMPTFPGGDRAMMDFISKNIVYPPLARDSSIQGKVRIKFVVDVDGTLRDIQVVGKPRLGYGLEEAAIAVVKKMPAWKPGKQNGKAVPVYFMLPISFKLY